MRAILQACRRELHRIFAFRPVFSVLILGAAVYAVLYPQPYLNEAVRDVPIAVVDLDGTQTSRDFARRVDATSDVAVAQVLPDHASAEREVFARRIDGILLIPKHFERDLLHGRPSPVALYADASYFLIYQRIAGAVTAVARTIGAEVEASRLVGLGVDPVVAVAATDPMPLTAVPLFNPEGGYATYVLPAAFVLILQQTLLIAVGLLGTLPGADHGTDPGERRSLVAITLGKLLAYLGVEAVILPAYLIALPYLYGLPRLGGLLPVLFFAIPFVLAVAGLGMVVAAVIRSALGVQLALAALGLPLFMMAGFSWPAEAFPPLVRLLSFLVPSTAAIDGFVKLSQLGAPLAAVRPQLMVLWGLAIFYNLIAIALVSWRAVRTPAHA